MYCVVKEVGPLNNYLLRLKFENEEEKVFDMKPYLETGIYKELKDEIVFKTSKVSFDTVEWANEADIDLETLYNGSVDRQNNISSKQLKFINTSQVSYTLLSA